MSCLEACKHSEEECITCIMQQGGPHFAAVLADLDTIQERQKTSRKVLVTQIEIERLRMSIELTKKLHEQVCEKVKERTRG